jgi:demethoxyubiquinone hydroxylase (CLK1/Coq7/Cat5 family)
MKHYWTYNSSITLNFRVLRRSISNDVRKHIRKAQATEIFRSKLFYVSNSNTTISVNDLDDLIKLHKIRPSLLVGALEMTASTLGVAVRLSPQPIRQSVLAAVQEASARHFNDSIRDITSSIDAQENELITDEIKESLKYHRDADVIPNQSETSSSSYKEIESFISLGVFQLLDITKKL